MNYLNELITWFFQKKYQIIGFLTLLLIYISHYHYLPKIPYLRGFNTL